MDGNDIDEELDAEVQAYTAAAEVLGGQGDNNELESMSLDELADYLRSNSLSLMAQNVAAEVFDSDDVKHEFEQYFLNFGVSSADEITFNYLKSFRRVRVNFPVGFDAICAKVELHQSEICGSITNVYLADQPLPNVSDTAFLSVPESDKMFLISPPPSPPVGWEAGYEEPPHPAPDLDLSAMNLSSSPASRAMPVSARNIQPIQGPTVGSHAMSSGASNFNQDSASNPTVDTMLLLTAFAHHCSQPGQVVEILPEDDGNPSIMVTSVDGPAVKDSESRHIGPIPRSPCPPFAVWPGDDEEENEENIPVYSDSDGETGDSNQQTCVVNGPV